jgi:hypothetical protein
MGIVVGGGAEGIGRRVWERKGSVVCKAEQRGGVGGREKSVRMTDQPSCGSTDVRDRGKEGKSTNLSAPRSRCRSRSIRA